LTILNILWYDREEMKKHYKVVTSDGLFKLGKQVDEYLNDFKHNWRLAGGIAVNTNESGKTYYYQALEDWS
jgi:hypothetical protein